MHGLRSTLTKRQFWTTGFGIGRGVSAAAPIVAIGMVALGIAFIGDGDLRKGLFPWAMASAALLLAVCCHGILRVHAPDPSRWILIGSWWTMSAFAGIAVFLFSIGVGGVLGIEEESVGILVWPPFLAMIFGILSVTPAMLVLAVGTTRSRVVPRWGSAAVWIAAPALPAVMISGGLAEGTAETIGLASLLGLFVVAWIVIGRSLLRAA